MSALRAGANIRCSWRAVRVVRGGGPGLPCHLLRYLVFSFSLQLVRLTVVSRGPTPLAVSDRVEGASRGRPRGGSCW